MRLHRLVRSCAFALFCFACVPIYGQPAADQTHPRTIDIASYVAEASQRFAIPEQWIYAVMRAESAGRIGAVSSAGAMGLMQLMPGTWARQRTRYGLGSDPFDPRDNIMAGSSYLREMYDSYGAPGFLAAYNAGPGRYEDWRNRGRPLPAETRIYVSKIAPMLQSAGAARAVASETAAQLLHLSWPQSALFTSRLSSVGEPPVADIGEDTVATPPAPPRPLGGLFALVSGSRVQ